MIVRLFTLLLLLIAAIAPSGCASVDEQANDQMDSYHSTPEKPEDGHGWGANVQPMGGQQQ